jgi:hypothetical protein
MKTWLRFTLYTLCIIMFGVSFFCYIIVLLSCENANLILFTGVPTAVFMFLITFIKDDYWEAVNKLLNK